ncbi:hypothetical protein PVK06_019995 [Gossypium arboreum]|uniref:Uncharacterized protein n=1 Tax=Gossypium arboreum TaxID=29729 RepID=A0ABR0PL71_GOSAR|nr:hypothetical protein PVK06_019995 [Gossypium arboreum]
MEWEEEEEGKDEEEEEVPALNEDFDEMFRPEQPSIGGVKIRTSSHTSPISFACARVVTLDTSRRKNPIIKENQLDPDSN